METNTISSSDSSPDSSPHDPYSHNYSTNEIHLKSSKAVYAALFANLAIFSIKVFFGVISKSSAMLSEAAHSLADAFNSFCLIIGLKRGQRPADEKHPFGYGLETSVWSLFACILMLLGSIISIYWGVERLFDPIYRDSSHLIQNYHLLITALLLALCFEAWAINSASKAVLFEFKQKPKYLFYNFIRSTKFILSVKSPTVRFVWFEDTAAILGVIIAIIATTLSRFVLPIDKAYIPDGIASIIIGLLLLFLAIYLLLTYLAGFGASAKPQTEEIIKDIALNTLGVMTIKDLKTMDMGSGGLIVNLEVEVAPEIPVKDVDDITQKIEDRIKERIPSVNHINIEVQANELEDTWEHKFSQVITEGIEKQVISKREGEILKNFQCFTQTTACEVMVPRIEINCLEKNQTIKDLIDLVISTGHTRIPIFDESIDNIIGVINSKDVFNLIQNGDDNKNIKLIELVRNIPIFPENKQVSILLNELINTKSQIAIIADEHGGIAGLVTIEDLLEEVFGEIWDEYDVEIIEKKRIDENTILLSAKVPIEEINESFDLDIPTEEFQTIGGYIFGKIGRIPKIKDTIVVGDYSFTVESMIGRKMNFIKLFKQNGLVDKTEELRSFEE